MCFEAQTWLTTLYHAPDAGIRAIGCREVEANPGIMDQIVGKGSISGSRHCVKPSSPAILEPQPPRCPFLLHPRAGRDKPNATSRAVYAVVAGLTLSSGQEIPELRRDTPVSKSHCRVGAEEQSPAMDLVKRTSALSIHGLVTQKSIHSNQRPINLVLRGVRDGNPHWWKVQASRRNI